jgi:hypothetical protein
MTNSSTKRWVAAAKILAVDPSAEVRCPENDDDVLVVVDQPSAEDPERIERILKCKSCGVWNAIRMTKP